jgi:hypothetical protein
MTIDKDKFVALETRVEKISKIVIGNGEKGMAETLRNVGDAVDRIEAALTTHVENDNLEERRRKSRRERLLEKFLIAAVALLGTGVGGVITYGFKLYPVLEKLLNTVP